MGMIDIMTHTQEWEYRLHLLAEVMDRESYRLEGEGLTLRADIAAQEATAYWDRAVTLRDELGPELALLAMAEEEEADLRAELRDEPEITWPVMRIISRDTTTTDDTDVGDVDVDESEDKSEERTVLTDLSASDLLW